MHRFITRLIIFCAVVCVVYTIGYWNGASDGTSAKSREFRQNIRSAAERDRKMVEDSIYSGKLPSPIKLGKYHYEIRSCGGAASSLFDHVESSIATISKDKHGYTLIHGSPTITQLISVDGQFFSWEDNESDDGYADNYHVGRINNGIVTGRTYYVHFADIGIKHFNLSPVMPTSSPSGNN